MTENEAIRDLDIIRFNPHWDELVKEEYWEELMTMALNALKEIQQYRAIGTVEEVRMLKDYKELYDVYKLIGTIEEFRNLKYKKNVLPIATIEFSKEDMQKMVDEKVAQIELDIQGIKTKAVDEFVNTLTQRLTDAIYRKDVESMTNLINDVARELKAGDT